MIIGTAQLNSDLPVDPFYGTIDAKIECSVTWDGNRGLLVFDAAVWKGGSRAVVAFDLIESLEPDFSSFNIETGDLWFGTLHLKIVERDLLRALYIVERVA